MVAQPTKNHLQCLVSAAIVLTLAGVFVAPTTFARVTANTIDPIALVTDNGRHIIVTGPIACTTVPGVETLGSHQQFLRGCFPLLFGTNFGPEQSNLSHSLSLFFVRMPSRVSPQNVGRNKRRVSGRSNHAGNGLRPLRLGSPVPAALAQAGQAYPSLRLVASLIHFSFRPCALSPFPLQPLAYSL